ncbi:hypothetical protein RclHR1_30610002 [Rhizophagus clarus]|uniref:Uncharacterized protein n=1 Tax=Rhizophagus clarus TaxID=94130 RepID=A0A2Z6R9R5_9GLOM|nr:hypothetical protein RclHR1_30610002 [Rhizophagus clarus]
MSKELQDDETSGSDTESASISEPHIHSIKTESLFTESRAASILSQFSVSDQDEVFVPNKEQRERENKFLGYYECLIDNSKLSIPTISISTARIDLHVVKSRKTEVEEGKHLVLTKIKESPSIKNTSILVITGKGRKIDRDDKGNIINEKLLKTLSKKKSNYEEWTGTKFNEFPGWMQKVKHLLDGEPIKGLGNYEVFIKKAVNASEISEDTLELLKREAEKEDDVIHKLALAGFYLKGNERNNGNYYETSKCYMEAKDLCLKTAKLKSNEAKLCLGYIYSVSLNRNKDHNPKKS